MSLPAFRVNSIDGVQALPFSVGHERVAVVDHVGIRPNSDEQSQLGSPVYRWQSAYVGDVHAVRVLVNGEQVVTRADLAHMQVVGISTMVLAATLGAFLWATLRFAWTTIRDTRRMRAWVARQPKPDGAPNTRGFTMYEGVYAREGTRPPLDRLMVPASAPAAIPAPTSVPSAGRIVRG